MQWGCGAVSFLCPDARALWTMHDSAPSFLAPLARGKIPTENIHRTGRPYGMHPLITEKRSEIALLCQKFGVTRLELFGSATDGDFAEEDSDFDFLVDFELSGDNKALDAYFGLKEGLEVLLGRP
jgi:uncharacterized protein